MHSSNTKIQRSIKTIQRCIETMERSIETIERCMRTIQRSIETIQCVPDAFGHKPARAPQGRGTDVSSHIMNRGERPPCAPAGIPARRHPPQAPETRALFRSDTQYAAVTAMPSSTATEPPITATSFGAAIQNPA